MVFCILDGPSVHDGPSVLEGPPHLCTGRSYVATRHAYVEVIVSILLAVESGVVPRLYTLDPVRTRLPHRHNDTATMK